MKSLVSTLIFSFYLILAFGQNKTIEAPTNETYAQITFEQPHVDIGSIKRGDKKQINFRFLNTGTEDLKIELVSGCDCTTLDWPRSLIKPGEFGVIEAIFDSTEKEKSGTVEIDINLKNIDPKSGYPMFKFVSYEFILEQ